MIRNQLANLKSLVFAVAAYCVLSSIVVCGVWIGLPDSSESIVDQILHIALQWDGQWYAQIAEEGYSHDKDTMSSVAFFPVYPLLSASLSQMLGCSSRVGLLLTSNVSLVFAFFLFNRYVEKRFPGRADQRRATVWSFALFPTMFFAPMAYSESVFMCLVLAVLIGLLEKWPICVVALLVGIATAARPVGIGLVLPIVARTIQSDASLRRRLLCLLTAIPLSLSGICIFMFVQWNLFDQPLAFVQTQDHWRLRPKLLPIEHLKCLLSLEPIWSTYTNEWPMGWHFIDNRSRCPFASLQAANPILFAGAVIAVFTGWLKKWLNEFEVLIGFGLLLIPYVTRSYEMCMAGQGRFLLPVFPLFIVLGAAMARLPTFARLLPILFSGTFLFVYSWMWAEGHYLI